MCKENYYKLAGNFVYKILEVVWNVFIVTIKPFSYVQSGINLWGAIQIIALGSLAVYMTIQKTLASYWEYIVIGLLFMAAVNIQWRIKNKLEIQDVLKKLLQLRVNGIESRNELCNITNVEIIKQKHDEMIVWKKNVVIDINKISPVDSGLWDYVGQYNPKFIWGAVKGSDSDIISIYTVLLERLEKVIEKWNDKIMRM